MGGGAFAEAYAEGEPTLNTPRMSPEVYRRLKSIFLEKLQDYFPSGKVVPLTEAPEKADYGDIDFFVALDQRVDFIDLAVRFGAAGVICHDTKKATLGVPKDGTAYFRAPVLYKHKHGNNLGKVMPSARIMTEEYAQVDVEIVSPDLLEWCTFYSAYSDMAGLLGHIVTQLGFIVTDRGLWLRLKELDLSKTVNYVNIADRDGMIFLSSDPKKVIQFLGCSVQEYEAGFSTLDDLYKWLGACRLLSADALKVKRNNAHERNREQKRTVYSRFFNEWLPAHMSVQFEEDEQRRVETVQHLRKQYLQEAVDFFSKRAEYEIKHQALALAINNGFAADLLKPIIAEHSGKQNKHINEILRAFRRYVGFDGNNVPTILSSPHSDEDSELHKFLDESQTSLKDRGMASEWVRVNWEELRAMERQRVKVGVVLDS